MSILTVGTTFSGIGAPEQALKNLGIPHVIKWACDNDKHAETAYFLNHDSETFYPDIKTIDPKDLEYVDLYVFGFPCQDVSVAGKQDLSGGRTALVEYSLNIIEEIEPKYFLYENVKGLLNKKFQPFLDSITGRLSEGYNLDLKVFNSKHFGTPQNRERVFCLGTRKDLDQVTLPEQDTTRQTHLSTILVDAGDEYTLPDHRWESLKAHKERHSTNGTNHGFGYRFVTDRAFTLLTTYYPLPHQLIEQEGKNPRFYTERECARLQGFPDSFQLHPTKRHAYKQLGNSITVPVLEAILERIPTGHNGLN